MTRAVRTISRRRLAANIRVIRFTPAPPLDRVTGLLGFLVLEIAGLVRVRDATLRRSVARRIYVAMPDRLDGSGHRLGLLAPIDGAARDAIDAAVLEALARDGLFPFAANAVSAEAAAQPTTTRSQPDASDG